jgi:hypothetical protein
MSQYKVQTNYWIENKDRTKPIFVWLYLSQIEPNLTSTAIMDLIILEHQLMILLRRTHINLIFSLGKRVFILTSRLPTYVCT